MWISFKNRPALQVAGRKIKLQSKLRKPMFNLKKGVCEKKQLKQIAKVFTMFAFFE